MDIYKAQSKRGIRRRTLNSLKAAGYTVAIVLAVTGAVMAYLFPSEIRLYITILTVAAIVAVATLAITSFIVKIGADRRSIESSLTITEDTIHGMSGGMLFNESVSDITEYYVEHSCLVIKTLTDIYEFNHFKNPNEAVKVLDMVTKRSK